MRHFTRLCSAPDFGTYSKCCSNGNCGFEMLFRFNYKRKLISESPRTSLTFSERVPGVLPSHLQPVSRNGRKSSKIGSALGLVLGVPTCIWRQVGRRKGSCGLGYPLATSSLDCCDTEKWSHWYFRRAAAGATPPRSTKFGRI